LFLGSASGLTECCLPSGAVGEGVQEPLGGWHVVGVGGADPFPAVALVIDGGQSEHGQEPGFAVGAVVGERLVRTTTAATEAMRCRIKPYLDQDGALRAPWADPCADLRP
jgi:hypothetical protein